MSFWSGSERPESIKWLYPKAIIALKSSWLQAFLCCLFLSVCRIFYDIFGDILLLTVTYRAVVLIKLHYLPAGGVVYNGRLYDWDCFSLCLTPLNGHHVATLFYKCRVQLNKPQLFVSIGQVKWKGACLILKSVQEKSIRTPPQSLVVSGFIGLWILLKHQIVDAR